MLIVDFGQRTIGREKAIWKFKLPCSHSPDG